MLGSIEQGIQLLPYMLLTQRLLYASYVIHQVHQAKFSRIQNTHHFCSASLEHSIHSDMQAANSTLKEVKALMRIIVASGRAIIASHWRFCHSFAGLKRAHLSARLGRWETSRKLLLEECMRLL